MVVLLGRVTVGPIVFFMFCKAILSYAGSGRNSNQFRLLAVCLQTVFIFTFVPHHKESKTSVVQVDTGENTRMLGAINLNGSVMICPTNQASVQFAKHGRSMANQDPMSSSGPGSGSQSGMMQICDLNQGRMSSIVCHKRELVYMDLDPSGQKAATAGVLGTIIRIRTQVRPLGINQRWRTTKTENRTETEAPRTICLLNSSRNNTTIFQHHNYNLLQCKKSILLRLVVRKNSTNR